MAQLSTEGTRLLRSLKIRLDVKKPSALRHIAQWSDIYSMPQFKLLEETFADVLLGEYLSPIFAIFKLGEGAPIQFYFRLYVSLLFIYPNGLPRLSPSHRLPLLSLILFIRSLFCRSHIQNSPLSSIPGPCRESWIRTFGRREVQCKYRRANHTTNNSVHVLENS